VRASEIKLYFSFISVLFHVVRAALIYYKNTLYDIVTGNSITGIKFTQVVMVIFGFFASHRQLVPWIIVKFCTTDHYVNFHFDMSIFGVSGPKHLCGFPFCRPIVVSNLVLFGFEVSWDL